MWSRNLTYNYLLCMELLLGGKPGEGPAKFKVAGCMSATGRERLQEPSLTPTGLGLVALLALGGRFGAQTNRIEAAKNMADSY
jgi:hypothetical protein